MPIAKKNTSLRPQKTANQNVVVVVKTELSGKDILFDKKLKKANNILSKTVLMNGLNPGKK